MTTSLRVAAFLAAAILLSATCDLVLADDAADAPAATGAADSKDAAPTQSAETKDAGDETAAGDATTTGANGLDPRQKQILREILVTALRTEKSWFDTPNTTQAVDADDIQQRKISRTMPEALSETPGVMVQKTGHGQGSPFIRGFTGFRTLMLIDGIRLNNSVFRDGPNQYWNTVDPLTIQRLEIIKGPSSALYGSDAIGGTVNAITRGRETFEPGTHWDRRIYYRYSTAENSHTGRIELSGNVGTQLGILLGGNYKHYGNLDGGHDVGQQSKTGYEEWNGDVKIEYVIDRDRRLVFAHYHVDQDDAWRSHATLYGFSWEGTTVGTDLKRILDQMRELTYLRYEARNLGGFVDAVDITLSYQLQQERQSRTRNNFRREKTGFDVHTLGTTVQLESPSSWGRWTYGVEYYQDWVSSFRRDFNADGTRRPARIQGPVADDATYGQFGAFVQNDIPVNDRLDLILGGRYTHVRVNARDVEDPATGNKISVTGDWNSLVGSARALYRLDKAEHWTAFGGVSQGFRAPNLSDLTRLDTARTNEIETPSPNLDPERYIQYELGVKSEYDRFRGQAAVFMTDVSDMIMRTPTGNVIAGDDEVTKQNSGQGWIHGVELEGWVSLHPQWSLFGGFTYVDGEVETYPTAALVKHAEPIDRLMPTTGYVGVRWESPARRVWVEGVCVIAGAADKLSTRDKADTQRIPPDGTPAYTTLTLRGGWKVNEDLTVFAAIENVTNEDYRIHGSGVNEAGINFITGLDWRF